MIFLQSTIVSRLANGPFWNRSMDKVENDCRSSWWPAILYVQNYIQPEALVNRKKNSRLHLEHSNNFFLKKFSVSRTKLVSISRHANVLDIAIYTLSTSNMAVFRSFFFNFNHFGVFYNKFHDCLRQQTSTQLEVKFFFITRSTNTLSLIIKMNKFSAWVSRPQF